MTCHTAAARQPIHKAIPDEQDTAHTLSGTLLIRTPPSLQSRTPAMISFPIKNKKINRKENARQNFSTKCTHCLLNCCLLRTHVCHRCSSDPGRKYRSLTCIYVSRGHVQWRLFLVMLLMALATPALGGDEDTREVREESAVPTPLPEDYFSEQPANASVPEGDIAVMKCKARMAVNHCRWYYIQMDKDFYQHPSHSKLVKDFKPTNDFDCSIRFTKVRKVQEGKWLCQARQFMKQTFFNTRPAFLEVVTESDEREYEERSHGDNSHTLSSSEEAIIGSQPPLIPADDKTSVPSVPTAALIPALPPQTRGGDHPPAAPRDWDPTAPTAIPALGPPLHSGPLLPPTAATAGSRPSTRRVLPGSSAPESGSSSIPTGLPQQPTGAGWTNDRDVLPRFSTSFDDHIQNTRTGGSALLPCHVDRPVASCAWVMPNNALFVWDDTESSVGRSLSINTPIGVVGPAPPPEYEFVGNRATGNCSLRLQDVTRHDEGNWRCVVGVHSPRHSQHPSLARHGPAPTVEAKGPLIHLHLLDYGHHYHEYEKPVTSPGTNITLIILFLVGLILFVVGSIVIYCCYKKVWSRADENSKMLNSSNRSDSDPDYTQQWFQGRNLKIVDPNYTDDFKLSNVNPTDYKLRNIDAMNLKNAQIKYSDIDHYNQYLSMSQGGGPDSVRSSASSNTTLTTVVPDPLGRERSISFGMSAHTISPTNAVSMGHHHNQTFSQGCIISPHGSIISQSPQADVENLPFYKLHNKLQRPVSLYSSGHVYEEIQEKIPYDAINQQHVMNSEGILVPVQGIQCGPIVTTPVYTNVVEDHDGYLIPNKSAKIVNTPTGDDDPTQYLPMRGDNSEAELKMLNEIQLQQLQHQQKAHGAPFLVGMNNLSNQKFHPTTQVQILDSEPRQQKVAQARRRSIESQLSVEQNSAICDDDCGTNAVMSSSTKDAPQNHNINSNSPTKQQTHKSASTTPNSKRQKMPLPSQPKIPSSSQSKTQASQQPASCKAQSLHKRTTSLPESALGSKINHAKSPSLVPTPENYDVPRSIGAVPRSVNGSEISLDDIDGTIV